MASKAKRETSVQWLARPEEHDYPAAASFLSLILPSEQVDAVVAALRDAPDVSFKAKDVIRASALETLDATNAHVANNLRKIAIGKAMSPILLVRGDARRGVHLLIADGYHRACASHFLDEDTDVPARIVDLP